MSLSRYLPCYQVVFRQHPGNDEACILSVHILCFPAPELLTPASQGGEGEGLMVCCYAVDCSISGLADTASHLHSQKWLWMMAGGWWLVIILQIFRTHLICQPATTARATQYLNSFYISAIQYHSCCFSALQFSQLSG